MDISLLNTTKVFSEDTFATLFRALELPTRMADEQNGDHSFAGQGITAVSSEFLDEHGSTCTRLDLSDNRIQYVSLFLQHTQLSDFEYPPYVVYCSFCLIYMPWQLAISVYRSGEWLSKLPQLKELILDRNEIEILKDYPRSHSVETLWMNNNSIGELKMFLDTIVKTVRRLLVSISMLTTIRHTQHCTYAPPTTSFYLRSSPT